MNRKEVIESLKNYNVLNSYSKFLCKSSDDESFFEVKLSFGNPDKIYTKEFNGYELVFNITVLGLKDIFNSMSVLSLVSNKDVYHMEVRVTKEETLKEETLIDILGFSNIKELTDEDINRINQLEKELEYLQKH